MAVSAGSVPRSEDQGDLRGSSASFPTSEAPGAKAVIGKGSTSPNSNAMGATTRRGGRKGIAGRAAFNGTGG